MDYVYIQAFLVVNEEQGLYYEQLYKLLEFFPSKIEQAEHCQLLDFQNYELPQE